MTQASDPAHPSLKPEAAAPAKAPLIGIIAGMALAGGLAFWTFQRIAEANTSRAEVEARRSEDSQRAAALAKEPALVSVVQGTTETWQPRIELDGTLQAQHEASLGFKVGGRLAHVAVEVGDRVSAGSVLARLDSDEANAQLTAAKAQVRAAETSLAMAEDAERRTLPLVKAGSVPEQTGVQVTQQRELAAAQLDSARAQLALAKVGFDNHVLAAPFGGTITQTPTGVGAVVAPGQPLFSLVDTGTLKLSTTVSEDDASLLAHGAEVHLATERGELSGRITAILATLDARTRRVPVVVEFDNAPRAKSSSPLRAGAFVRAWVAAKDPIPVVRVPHGVLRPGSRDEVLVVDAAERLELRKLVYAVDKDGGLLVRRGLDVKDRVVLAPMPEAKAGDTVRVASSAPPSGATPAATAPVPAPASAAATAGTP